MTLSCLHPDRLPTTPHFWNSMDVVVVASSTRGQFPAAQTTLFPGELLLATQYAAAEYCSHKFNSRSSPAETSGPRVRKSPAETIHSCSPLASRPLGAARVATAREKRTETKCSILGDRGISTWSERKDSRRQQVQLNGTQLLRLLLADSIRTMERIWWPCRTPCSFHPNGRSDRRTSF
jgi:hypothetical protein